MKITIVLLSLLASTLALPAPAAEPEADIAERTPGGYGSYGKYGKYGGYGKYGSYGTYKREAEPAPVVKKEAEPEPGYGDYGDYGDYGTYPGVVSSSCLLLNAHFRLSLSFVAS